jgi:signal transduction histidine kinase/HAMP domain-containing protein
MKMNIGLKMPITARLLSVLLSLTFISMLALAIIAVQVINSTAEKARESSLELGQIAVEDSTAALTSLGEEAIQQKAVDVARQVQIFLDAHGILSSEDRSSLARIAVQPVGKTGYTFIYDRYDAVIVYHVNPELIGVDLAEWAKNLPAFWSIFEAGLSGESSKGYYDWEDKDGLIREKYMYVAPVEETRYMLGATTYIDEFSTPASEISDKINEAADRAGNAITTQKDIMLKALILAIGILMIIAGSVAWYLAKQLSRPILTLSEGARQLSEGKLDHRVDVKTGDEIEELAKQFNTMASALQETHTTLEQRVEERTRAEKQRSEQLRAINKVSQRIISLMNLDDLLPFVVYLFRETFGYYCVSIYLINEVSGQLLLKAMSGPKQDSGMVLTKETSDKLIWRVVDDGESLLINDVSVEAEYLPSEDTPDTRSELAVPVRLSNDIMGVLDIKSSETDAFDDLDVFTASTLADFVAIVIENSRLYQDVQEIAKVEERNRLAREIHDILAQGFIGIILQLDLAEQSITTDRAEVAERINKAKILAKDSLNEARRSVSSLRPPVKERVLFSDTVQKEAEKSTEISGIPVTIDVKGTETELPVDVQEPLLRIFQEAVTNTRRHANATEIDVSLSFNTGDIILAIHDNGIGFNTRRKKQDTFGLIGMRERVRLMGGKLDIKSKPGQGTTITVKIRTEKE